MLFEPERAPTMPRTFNECASLGIVFLIRANPFVKRILCRAKLLHAIIYFHRIEIDRGIFSHQGLVANVVFYIE